MCYYLAGGLAPVMNERVDHVRWFRTGALAAALFAIFLVAIGASFWHTDAPGSEASCSICHVSHMPVLPGAVVIVQAMPKLLAWLVPAETHIAYCAPAGLDSPPRAPPA